METDHYFRINELKNAVYCLRIPYYALCLQLDIETALSRLGIESEAQVKQRMKRRKHALHAIHDGQRHFDVEVVYHPQQLIGRLDEVIETEAGLYLVDYKDTDQDYGYWKLQMCAYRLGIQAMGATVLGCYIYTIPDQTYHSLKIIKRDEKKLDEILKQLQRLLAAEQCPLPTPHQRKCLSCQYAKFCNDIM